MTKQIQDALKMAIEALEFIKDGGFYTGEDDCIQACKEALEQPIFLDECIAEIDAEIERTREVKCKTHPDAPHGFMRDESHSQDRYVCECEYWTPPAKTITEGSQLSNLKVSSKSEKPLPPPAPKHICIYSKTMNQEYPRKCIHCGEVEGLAPPAQEPVAWMDSLGYVMSDQRKIETQGSVGDAYTIPLYTHPCALARKAPSCQECKNLKHDLEGYMEANKALINHEW